MKNLKFSIDIHASSEQVYRTMLGLDDKTTYETWSAEFNPTSTYRGSWKKDEKIKFIGTAENGEQGGMISKIVELQPNKFVSLNHVGVLKGDEEVYSGDEVDVWAGGFENYAFEESNNITTVTVTTDTNEGYIDYFNSTWPKALARLKEIVEAI